MVPIPTLPTSTGEFSVNMLHEYFAQLCRPVSDRRISLEFLEFSFIYFKLNFNNVYVGV